MVELRELMDRVKAAEREFHVVALAVERHRRAVSTHQVVLPLGISRVDLDATAANLEPTYLVRIWAEFETALRSFWRHKTSPGPNDSIGTTSLIDWAAGVRQGRAISIQDRLDVHAVRQYRNFLVHQADDPKPPSPISIAVARRGLNVYPQKLPERW